MQRSLAWLQGVVRMRTSSRVATREEKSNGQQEQEANNQNWKEEFHNTFSVASVVRTQQEWTRASALIRKAGAQ